MAKNHYFTHNCAHLTTEHLDDSVTIAGWVSSKRDHGGLLFLDIRDHTGLVQCLIEDHNPAFAICDDISLESVVQIVGKVNLRPEDTFNPDMKSGKIEIRIESINVLSDAMTLPFALYQQDVGEEVRLKYRFLDLRREEMQVRLKLRANIIKTLRREIESYGFIEVQTPLLTASSPEGARDYVVPSRLHHGKFYVLPQAPQQFKQLLMVGGVNRYYQVAPCFRDEDTRADRAPGAFYQLDLEMAFATQDNVLEVVENVLYKTFREFSTFKINTTPFPRITYREAMDKYASDKPDLRNPLEYIDIFDKIAANPPQIFKSVIENSGKLVLLNVPELATKSRSFFDQMQDFVQSLGAKGLGYILNVDGQFKGPLANILPDSVKSLVDTSGAFVLAHSNLREFYKIAAALRDKIGNEMDLIERNSFKFCWIVDFPMYEMDENGSWDFSHNPFSMPQGGMDSLNNKNPGDIVAYQYDIVCNGCELSSGAVRNHQPEIMYRAFEIVGYTKEEVDAKFGAMINAFRYGAPPHAGCAPGIDRIVMLLAGVKNLREIIPFPLTQAGVDLMMNAPSELSTMQLKELGLKLIEKNS